jgi:hypothetical protein
MAHHYEGDDLIVGLRSLRLVAATVLTLVFGLICTAGVAAVLVGHLNLISVAFAVLFVGLGVLQVGKRNRLGLFDLGLGRVRTLSPEGRQQAAERWLSGDAGPDAPLAKSAPQTCHSCGFMLRLAGPLSDTFGVCANGDANDDGRVVAFSHGCGAHSEPAKTPRPPQPPPPVIDHVGADPLDMAD